MFVGSFLSVAVWETRQPNREWIIPTGRRWTLHGAMWLLGAVLSVLLLRLTPVAAAVVSAQKGWGWMPRTGLPGWVLAVLTVLLMDFTKYWSHRLFHMIPALWRFHRVHHSDPDFDISTSWRFHPLEQIAMRSLLIGVIVVSAPPPGAVLVAELISIFSNFFDHANADLPAKADRFLRRWLVTPSVHRLHHGLHESLHGRNLGEIFPWWDRLLGTYTEPDAEDRKVEVGLRGYPHAAEMGVGEILTEPFRGDRTAP
jgi:sterol desaturase/sphingolipid hydroxylase (fatty acid hydroxylase superfamily)